VDVLSAEDMLSAVKQRLAGQDVFIGCAAVADYRAADIAAQKMKKQGDDENISLQLVKNPDILAWVAAQPGAPYTCGFAAETQQVADYAQAKLARKGIQMIAANDVSDARLGFNTDDNAIELFWRSGENVAHASLGQASKSTLATQILEHIAAQLR
jgi:phosphopantothenoylcysteine decarboxylase/phosphopantothenate--cysteine ligase